MSIPIANDFAAIAANMRNDTSEMDAPGAGGPDAELLAMCIAFHRQNAAAQAVRSSLDFSNTSESGRWIGRHQAIQWCVEQGWPAT
jgi:hypothetical protein